jgi:coproporphyrinogen III oxidase-like Fe-S oxidoreductase
MNETINSVERKVSAYIHIPFCEHICYYCDFDTLTNMLFHMNSYENTYCFFRYK